MFDPAPTTIRTSLTFAPTKRVESEALARLRATRERITDPAHWCQGMMIEPFAHQHVCVLGALLLASGEQEATLRLVSGKETYRYVPPSLLQAAQETWDPRSACVTVDPHSIDANAVVWMVNDHMGHAATLQMLDRAIEIETQAAKS